jgi:excisionase family DNA binding protein
MSQESGQSLPVEDRDWYTIQEAAAFLEVSEPTIFRWMKQGTLSFYKVGNSTRFSKQGLESVVTKQTGEKEAQQSLAKCAICGNGELADGQIQGTGRIFFRPAKSKFWVLSEGLVPTSAKVCTACGHVQMHADTAKLKLLLKGHEKKPKDKKS